MSKQKQQGEKLPMGGNPFAGFDRDKLIEIAVRQEAFIQTQENDINNLLQAFISLTKLNQEWGKSMIVEGTKYFEVMLNPSVKNRLPKELQPGQVPGDMQPMTKEEAMKKIEELKASRLKNLESAVSEVDDPKKTD